MIHKAPLAAIAKHAVADYPNEACGLLIVRKGRQKYIPCRNIHPEPAEAFVISPEDRADAEDIGEIVAVIHTHPNASPEPSQADRVQCEAWSVPWYIFNVHSEAGQVHIGGCTYTEPCGYIAPLVGRKFYFGVLDCYTLIRDYYKMTYDLLLPDFEREDGFWRKGQELYLENFRKAGFEQVIDGSLQPGDGVLMQIRDAGSPNCEVTNHAGIYLGDDWILHHLMGRLSSRDVYSGHYHQCTRMIVRHKGVSHG